MCSFVLATLMTGLRKWLVLLLAALGGSKAPFFPFSPLFHWQFWIYRWGGLASLGLHKFRVYHMPEECLAYPPGWHSLKVRGHTARVCWLLLNPSREMKEFCRLSWKIKSAGRRLVFAVELSLLMSWDTVCSSIWWPVGSSTETVLNFSVNIHPVTQSRRHYF